MPNLGGQQFFKGRQQYAKDINRLITSRTPTGKIFLQEDFETITALSQRMAVDGSLGFIAAISQTRALSGSHSLRLDTNINNNDWADMRIYFGPPYSRKIGYEGHWMIGHDVDNPQRIKYIDFGLEWWDTLTNLVGSCGIRHTLVNIAGGEYRFDLGYWGVGGVYIPLPAKFHFHSADNQYKWTHWKFVADFSDLLNPKYLYYLNNDVLFDLRGYIGQSTVHVNEPGYIEPSFTITTNGAGGAGCDIYLDDIILTEEDAEFPI